MADPQDHMPELLPLTRAEKSAKFYANLIMETAPFSICLVLSIGFFSVLFRVLVYGIPQNGGEALLVMLGSLGTAWTTSVGYFFVSSAGSKQNRDTLNTAMKAQSATIDASKQ